MVRVWRRKINRCKKQFLCQHSLVDFYARPKKTKYQTIFYWISSTFCTQGDVRECENRPLFLEVANSKARSEGIQIYCYE